VLKDFNGAGMVFAYADYGHRCTPLLNEDDNFVSLYIFGILDNKEIILENQRFILKDINVITCQTQNKYFWHIFIKK